MHDTATPHAYAVQRVLVYTDVPEGPLLEHVREAARALVQGTTAAANRVVVIHEKDLVARQAASPAGSPPTPSAPSPQTSLAFIREWEREKADFRSAVEDPLPWMARVECFVTDKYTLHSGPVAYALHCLQLPVLSLTSARTDLPTPPPLPVETALYFDLTRLGGHDGASSVAQRQEASVAAFFTNLSHSKSGGIATVEWGRDDVADSDVNTVAMALMQSSANTQATTKDGPAIMCVNDAGFPAWWCPPTPAAAADDGAMSHYARVEPAFQSLLDSLTAKDSSFADLRAYNPQLVGALKAFNRYQNRGLVRALVQQGYTVVFMNFLRTTAQQLLDADEAAFASNLCAVLRFESHWLELPLPTKGLVAASQHSDLGGKASALTPPWVTKAVEESDPATKTALAALLPWLSAGLSVLDGRDAACARDILTRSTPHP